MYTNCAGLALAEGKIWLNPDQGYKALKEDNDLLSSDYNKSGGVFQNGDIIVWKDGKSTQHFAVVTNVDEKGKIVEVTGEAGLDTSPKSSTLDKAWSGKGKIEVWREKPPAAPAN